MREGALAESLPLPGTKYSIRVSCGPAAHSLGAMPLGRWIAAKDPRIGRDIFPHVRTLPIMYYKNEYVRSKPNVDVKFNKGIT